MTPIRHRTASVNQNDIAWANIAICFDWTGKFIDTGKSSQLSHLSRPGWGKEWVKVRWLPAFGKPKSRWVCALLADRSDDVMDVYYLCVGAYHKTEGFPGLWEIFFLLDPLYTL